MKPPKIIEITSEELKCIVCNKNYVTCLLVSLQNRRRIILCRQCAIELKEHL